MADTLKLAHLRPFAAGSTRFVYRHPDDPDLVVKVIRPELVARRFGKDARMRISRRRYRQFLIFLREVREHLAVYAHDESGRHFMQSIVGFVETDLGLGLVARAVRGHDGELAPTLEALVCENRFTDAVRRDLERLVEQVRASEVVVADLNPTNIVYGWDAEHGDHFVLVDGLGEKTLIPVRSFSRRLNRIGKERFIRRLYCDIARLAADPTQRRRSAKKTLPAELPARAG